MAKENDMPSAPSGVIDAHRELQADLANFIERFDAHIETHGGSRTTSLARTHLETAALWFLAEEGAMCGSSIIDGLRGI